MSDDESDIDSGRLFPDLGSILNTEGDIRVRFYNLCPDKVDVFWMNHARQPTKYATLEKKQYLDVRTYENHPWVVRRSFDGCKALVNKKLVYWPVRSLRPNVIVRHCCVITLKVQTLREMSARSMLLEDAEQVTKKISNLPRELEFEVKHLMNTKQEYSEIVCRSIAVRPPRPRPRQNYHALPLNERHAHLLNHRNPNAPNGEHNAVQAIDAIPAAHDDNIPNNANA